MVLAVLEARCGLTLGNQDVYLNIAGGLKITEPAADIAVAAALISAMEDIALGAETAVFGEISLSGDVRPVSRALLRLKEAEKLGFSEVLAPPLQSKEPKGLNIHTLDTLGDLIRTIRDQGQIGGN